MDIPETRNARSGDVSIAYHERIDDDDLVPSEWRLFAVDATTTT